MVAQLKSVGITGIMYVELDRRDPAAPDLSPEIKFPSNYPVIATRPSEITRFFGEIGTLLERIGTIDLEGISTHLKETLSGLRQAVADLNTAAISAELRRTLLQVTEILDTPKWHNTLRIVENAAQFFGDFSESADRAVKTIDRAAARFDGFLAKNDPQLTAAIADLNRSTSAALELLRNGDQFIVHADVALADLKRQLVVTLQHLEASGQNLKTATETVSDQPARLIFGNAPPDRTLPEETAP
jgi:phospholipid/cholesterol/gamma-HCH transport system substrate-binding protein